jgi:hypothetical protein
MADDIVAGDAAMSDDGIEWESTACFLRQTIERQHAEIKRLREKVDFQMWILRLQSRAISKTPMDMDDEAFLAGATERLLRMRAARSRAGDSAASGTADSETDNQPGATP